MRRAPLHVVIDCRKAGDLGIGRYIRGLVDGLRSMQTNARFTLLVDARASAALPSDEQFVQRAANVGHYRLHEPFVMGRIVDAVGADVFHAPHYVYPIIRTPGIVTIHDLIHLNLRGLRNAPRRLYARAMIGRAIRSSREIVTVSSASAADIVRRWPAAAGRITVTPNGVDESFFLIDHAPSDPPTLLYAGNDKPHKNLDRLAEAWRRSKLPAGARLVIAGSAPERLRGIAGIELAGFVPEGRLRTLYREATALVLPSIEEGFGLPVVEAMAAGVPVIASKIAPVMEVTRDAALLFDPFDVDSIASAIARIMSEDDTRAQLAAAGRVRANEFRWTSVATATFAAYQRASSASEPARK